MKDLNGKVAFITGGANGIGLGIARNLLKHGCKVAIADIREDSIATALESLNSEDAKGYKLDVASREEYAAVADQVEAELGPVSLLFNNAGINLFQTIEESTYDDWDWVMGVNLHGVINGVQTFVPRMVERKAGGHVVNTASMASFLASGTPGIYNTTKFAVRGLSESLWYSLAPHDIGVSVLCPGLVDSYIYASDDVRPAELGDTSEAALNRPFTTEQLAESHKAGMHPDEVGEKVVKAILENRHYIFSHPEFKEEVQEVFDGIMTEFTDEEPEPMRAKFEEFRRAGYKAAREAAKNREK